MSNINCQVHCPNNIWQLVDRLPNRMSEKMAKYANNCQHNLWNNFTYVRKKCLSWRVFRTKYVSNISRTIYFERKKQVVISCPMAIRPKSSELVATIATNHLIGQPLKGHFTPAYPLMNRNWKLFNTRFISLQALRLWPFTSYKPNLTPCIKW